MVVCPSSHFEKKYFWNFPRPMRSCTVKENHIRSTVSEIIRYTQTVTFRFHSIIKKIRFHSIIKKMVNFLFCIWAERIKGYKQRDQYRLAPGCGQQWAPQSTELSRRAGQACRCSRSRRTGRWSGWSPHTRWRSSPLSERTRFSPQFYDVSRRSLGLCRTPFSPFNATVWLTVCHILN